MTAAAPEMADVLVVGAGPTGLTLAWPSRWSSRPGPTDYCGPPRRRGRRAALPRHDADGTRRDPDARRALTFMCDVLGGLLEEPDAAPRDA